MGFVVKVAPVATWDNTKWRVPITLEYAIGDKELFAYAYGDTREIAAMRAELVAIAINRGVGK